MTVPSSVWRWHGPGGTAGQGDPDGLVSIVTCTLKKIQYRRYLIGGWLAGTSLTPETLTWEAG